MTLRDDALELVRVHQQASVTPASAPWEEPDQPEWCAELAAALWESSYRPHPAYFQLDSASLPWRGPTLVRLHHLGFGWQLTAHAETAIGSAAATVVLLETGSLWHGLGTVRQPSQHLWKHTERDHVEGLLPSHDVYITMQRLRRDPRGQEPDYRTLFGVAGMAALIEDAVDLGPNGELGWQL
ncbi:hypothetical protein HQQ80_05140 [Microbacteriaceae bacterium VKM Ac-2855]|nr:hypothetical protein [Microbacteriaceae bacterium VKM Ac-2855]